MRHLFPTALPLAALCLAASMAANHAKAQGRCGNDETTVELLISRGAAVDSVAMPSNDNIQARSLGDPQNQLQQIAREALNRSAQMRSSGLAAEAADLDVEEASAASRPQVSVGASLMAVGSRLSQSGLTEEDGGHAQSQLSLNATGPIYDGGRRSSLTQYRKELAGAADLSTASLRERVVLDAITYALERNRLRLQIQVYQQYVRKMSCLTAALEQIVAQDRGRASELVQARKNQRQAEISRDGAITTVRQIDARLRKIVGENVMPWSGIGVPLASLPDFGEILRQIDNSNDVRQLVAQAQAYDVYSKAVAAGGGPQLNWVVGGAAGKGNETTSRSWQAGVTLNWTLYNGGGTTAAANAATKRAEAIRQQLDEVLNDRKAQAAQLREAAVSAFDRAKTTAEVLRDSDRVRNYTLEQWSQLGRRSLFDVMGAEAEHYNLRVAYINALYDGFSACAQLRSLGSGLAEWLVPAAH